MRTLAAGSIAHAETDVKKSRFIARVARAASEEEARAVIASQRIEFPDARHHCSAFILESDGATARTHSSDDGEPSGTAGAPMLEVLSGADLTNVVAVVTRYFGGTLLGTGGLVRAYSGAVQAALAEAKLVEVLMLPQFSVVVHPGIAGKVDAEIRRRGWIVSNASWDRDVAITFTVPVLEEADVRPLLAAVTRSQPRLSRLEDVREEVALRTT